MDETRKPDGNGVAEDAVAFDAEIESDPWAIARARWEEHQRTGAGTMSIDEVGSFLRREVVRLRATKA